MKYLGYIRNLAKYPALSNRPNDQANGYSLSLLESNLSQEPTNWTDYRNQLRDNTSNPTENQALFLFDNYDQ